MTVALSAEEISALTGFRPRAPRKLVLAALHKLGYHRAYINRAGSLVLERPHFDAVSRGTAGTINSGETRPKLRPRREA